MCSPPSSASGRSRAHHPSGVALAALEGPPARNDAETSSGQRGRILIAEADVDAAFTLAVWLERQGYQVALAATGDAAACCAAQSEIDVVFVSEALPDMSREELAQRLRARTVHGDLRIIATGSPPQSSDAGFDTSLPLPLTSGALREALRG